MELVESFCVGQRVIFRPDNHQQWYEGRITQVDHSNSLCQVEQYELNCEAVSEEEEPLNFPGDEFSVPCDFHHIRPSPAETPYYEQFQVACEKMPTFVDPLERLYAKNGVDSCQDDDLVGMPGKDVLRKMANDISSRRPFQKKKLILSYSPRQLLDSISHHDVDNVESLRELALKDSYAMLQLADTYNYGLLGVERDGGRAFTLYHCAARGISDMDVENLPPLKVRFAFPLGPPEALCAAALTHWVRVQKNFSQLAGTDDPKGLLAFLVEDMGVVNTQHQITFPFQLIPNDVWTIVSLLCHAIRRDWVSPLAMVIGQALRDLNLLDPFIPDSISFVRGLDIQQKTEYELPASFRQGLGITSQVIPSSILQEHSQPSLEQIDMFARHATSVFLSLPIRSMNPLGNCPSDRHIEYRELLFPPYDIVVIDTNPQTGYIFPMIKVRGAFMYDPFSTESFAIIWSHFVFSMHMGDKQGGCRTRPALITLADRPGDKKLATFIQDQIGKRCGTEIRIVDTFQCNIQQYGGTQKRSLFDIMSEFESSLTEGLAEGMDWQSGEILTPIEQQFYDNRIETPADKLIPDLNRLKEEGNEYFGRGNYFIAKKCYSEAIETIRSAINTDSRIHQLLGTLLSNRALCSLKMVEGMGNESAKNTMKSVISDCDIVMKSNWASAIPKNIQKKTKTRRQEALKIIDRISSQNPTPMLPPQEAQQQQQTQPAGGRCRRGNKKKKQRRKKKNKQSNPQHENADDDDSDEGTSIIILGRQLLGSDTAPNITGIQDPCPCCLDRLWVELSETYTAVNVCGHVACLPCLSSLWKKHCKTKGSTNSSRAIPWTCPICRYPLPETLLTHAVGAVVDGTPSLQDRISLLPLHKTEANEVARNLLMIHDFMIRDVVRAMDYMLTDGLQSRLRRSTDLSPIEKQHIYEEARGPANALFDEMKGLTMQLEKTRDTEGEEFRNVSLRLKELQLTVIPDALKDARGYIWEHINSAGKMGIEDDETGEIEVDFHALHVSEAKDLFDSLVLPVLEAVGRVLIVVGRGTRSEGKVSKLKPALQRHMDQRSKRLRYHDVADNDGAILVCWKKQS